MNTSTTRYDELVKESKQSTCKVCQAGSRYASKRIRVVLGEISTNVPKSRASQIMKCKYGSATSYPTNTMSPDVSPR
jgi:hypothetical protein